MSRGGFSMSALTRGEPRRDDGAVLGGDKHLVDVGVDEPYRQWSRAFDLGEGEIRADGHPHAVSMGMAADRKNRRARAPSLAAVGRRVPGSC